MSIADQRVVVAKDVHVRRFDGDLVLLNLAKGDYFGVNEVGAHLWEGLALGRTPREVAAELVDVYDVPLDELLADLVRLTGELEARGLVRVRESGV